MCLGGRDCLKRRQSLHRSPQAIPSPPVRMQTPQARRCFLEPWEERRSTESWGRCQTPRLLLRQRLERRGEQLTYGKVSTLLPLPGDAALVAEARRQLALPAFVPSHPYLPVSRIQLWESSNDELWVYTSPWLQGGMGMEDQMLTGGVARQRALAFRNDQGGLQGGGRGGQPEYGWIGGVDFYSGVLLRCVHTRAWSSEVQGVFCSAFLGSIVR